MDDRSCHDFRDGGAARNVDYRFPRDDPVNRGGARGIGVGGLYASVGRAAPPGDDRFCPLRGFLHDVERGPPADAAVDPPFRRRHGAFHEHQVFPPVFLHCRMERLLGLFPGRGLEGLGVVQRDLVEDDIGNDRVGRAYERLAAAGTLLEMKPDNREPRLCVERFDNLGYAV